MRLIFDARPIAQEFTGLGRYTGSLLRELLTSAVNKDLDIDVLIDGTVDLSNNGHMSYLRPFESMGRCRFRCIPASAISLEQQIVVPRWVNKAGGDFYFYPHFDLPLAVNIPSIFVVHDLIPVKVEGYVRNRIWAKKLYFRQMLRFGVMRASRCIAVSKTTKSDILDLVGLRYEKKIEVAFEGPVLDADDLYRSCNKSLLQQPYLLYVGDRRPHKNIKRMVDLYLTLRNDFAYAGKLFIVGSKQNHGFDLDGYVADIEGIEIVGNVSDDDLREYYRNAEALLFLSEYEGFGLPVVEAARYGKKMILSDGGSLPEIAPPSALIVSRAMAIDRAASIVAAYLREPTKAISAEYFDQYSWSQASRAIFPFAYS